MQAKTTDRQAILFPIEITSRELLCKLSLAIKFAQNGHKVYIGAKEEIHRLLSILQSYIYFDKGYHAGISEKLYECIKRNNGTIISLDEEGGVDYNDLSAILRRYPDSLFKIADMIFLWGRRQYDFLKSNRKNFDPLKVAISGHPRFELLKPRFHALYKNEAESFNSQYGRYILINTNMSFGNNIRGDVFVRQNYGFRIKNIDDVIEYDKIKRNVYISFIKRLSPMVKKTIIFRAHPEEDSSVYLRAFSKLPNVKIISHGSAIPWILGSDVMIHPDCTTGIEAVFIGKQPVSYLPPTIKSVVTEIPVKVSVCFRKEEECLSYIVNGQYKNVKLIQYHDLLNEMFAHDSNTSDFIVEVTRRLSTQSAVAAPITIDSIKRSIIYKHQALRAVEKVLNRHTRNDPLMRSKRIGLDFKSLNDVYRTITKIIEFGDDISIKKLWDSLYCIEK